MGPKVEQNRRGALPQFVFVVCAAVLALGAFGDEVEFTGAEADQILEGSSVDELARLSDTELPSLVTSASDVTILGVLVRIEPGSAPSLETTFQDALMGRAVAEYEMIPLRRELRRQDAQHSFVAALYAAMLTAVFGRVANVAPNIGLPLMYISAAFGVGFIGRYFLVEMSAMRQNAKMAGVELGQIEYVATRSHASGVPLDPRLVDKLDQDIRVSERCDATIRALKRSASR